MSTLRGILNHRADVARATTTNVNGVPQTTWATVATTVPVLLDHTGKPQDSATATQTAEADRNGSLLTAPETDIRPGDRLTITAPGFGPSTWTVSPYPSFVSHLHGAHHREHQLQELP